MKMKKSFKNIENASQSYYRPSWPLEKIKEVREALQKDLADYLEARADRVPGGVGGRLAAAQRRVREIVEENFNKLLPPEANWIETIDPKKTP
jgi:hypothetical protein